MFEPGECLSRPDLEAFWDDELDACARDGVLRHLEVCGRCAAEARQQEALTLLLRAGDPAEALPPQAVQRLRSDLLQRAGTSLLEERSPAAVRPKRRWGPLQTFFTLGPVLAAAWIIAQRAPGLLPQSPAVQVPRQAQANPQRSKPHGALPDAAHPALNKPLALRNRWVRMPATPLPSPSVAVAAATPMRVTTELERATPVTPVHRLRPPVAERLVIDLSQPVGSPRPRVASVTLVASGSPDTVEGEAVIIRTDVMEETP